MYLSINDENTQYNEYFNEHNMKILEESATQAKAGKIVTKTMSELEAMELISHPPRT